MDGSSELIVPTSAYHAIYDLVGANPWEKPMTTDPGTAKNPTPPAGQGPGHSVRSRFANALVKGGFLFGALAIVFSVFAFAKNLDQIAVAFFVALASAGTGCVAGFLFGVPKLASASLEDPLSTAQAQKLASTTLLFNTNLGQISDWITKIVVGLGLTRIRRDPGRCSGLGWTVLNSL